MKRFPVWLTSNRMRAPGRPRRRPGAATIRLIFRGGSLNKKAIMTRTGTILPVRVRDGFYDFMGNWRAA